MRPALIASSFVHAASSKKNAPLPRRDFSPGLSVYDEEAKPMDVEPKRSSSYRDATRTNLSAYYANFARRSASDWCDACGKDLCIAS